MRRLVKRMLNRKKIESNETDKMLDKMLGAVCCVAEESLACEDTHP